MYNYYEYFSFEYDEIYHAHTKRCIIPLESIWMYVYPKDLVSCRTDKVSIPSKKLYLYFYDVIKAFDSV